MFILKVNFEQALKYQTCSALINERNIDLNLTVGSEHQKLAYLSQISDDLDQTISLSVGLGRDNADAGKLAASQILQRKGRVLDAVAGTMASLRLRSSSEDKKLLDRLASVNGALADVTLNRPDNLSADAYERLLADLRSKKESLEQEIGARTRKSFAEHGTISLTRLQELIPNDTAVVEYAVYRPVTPAGKTPADTTRYAVFVIDRSGVVGSADLGPATEVDRSASMLRTALRDPKRQDFVRLSRALDQMAVAPVRKLIRNYTHLIISPDSELNLVPFEAIYDPSGQPLVANHQITYLTSGRDLARMQIKRESRTAPTIIADPLFEDTSNGSSTVAKNSPSTGTVAMRRSATTTKDISDTYFAPLAATAREAQAIQTLFPDSKLLSGAQATETAVKNISAPKLLHIATHGFFLQGSSESLSLSSKTKNRIENPLLRSGLALAGANRHTGGSDDGMFTALEASGLDLWGTKLVVLSACDTGLGDVRTGEGVYGLRRAIAIAGSESLVMSLWPVSDLVTRELMTKYYTNLKAGLGRGEALRQVQLTMLKNPNRRHPFYWASFIQSGEWADLNGKR
jgi:CHAT domain-containing protein